MSRSYSLTQKIFDVSTMLGYVGQGCCAHEATGKANLFRPRARAGLCICPAEDASAQLFFDLKSMRLQLVQSVSFASTSALVSGLLADLRLYASSAPKSRGADCTRRTDAAPPRRPPRCYGPWRSDGR